MRRAFSYSRVSSGPQVIRGKGLARQLDMARTWAAANGATLDESLDLSDRGRSASKGDHLQQGAALARFLAAALAGELGEDPILVVEDLTRLSRQEPLDALEQVLQPLLRAGVEVITLEDGARYTRDRLNQDPASLIVLVVKIQAAADYSRKLARYSLHRRAQNRADILNGLPVCTGWAPAWIHWDGTAWQFTDYVATVRLLVKLSWRYGCDTTCRLLNQEGHRSPSGGQWTPSQIGSLLRSPALYGARRVAAPGYGEAVRRWKHNGGGPGKPRPEYQLVPGTWPAVLTADEFEALQGLVQARRCSAMERGRRDQMLFVGALLTTCTCGAPIGVRSLEGGRYVYLVCRGRQRGQTECKVTPMRLEGVHAALLTRLQGVDLARVLVPGGDQVEAAQRCAAEARGALAAAEAREANARAALRERAMTGRGMLEVYEEALVVAGGQVAAAREALSQARAAVDQLQAGPDAADVVRSAAGLLQAFARGQDTAEQRRGLHRLLREMGVRLVLDMGEKRLGIGREEDVQWEVIDPLQEEMLRRGKSGVRTEEIAGGVVAESTSEVLFASTNEQSACASKRSV